MTHIQMHGCLDFVFRNFPKEIQQKPNIRQGSYTCLEIGIDWPKIGRINSLQIIFGLYNITVGSRLFYASRPSL